MIGLKWMRRMSRLEEDYTKLWKDFETPMSFEMRYKRNAARMEKRNRELAERETSAGEKTSDPSS